jgi:hypothetical protein
MSPFTECYLAWVDEKQRVHYWPKFLWFRVSLPWWVARVFAEKWSTEGHAVAVVRKEV